MKPGERLLLACNESKGNCLSHCVVYSSLLLSARHVNNSVYGNSKGHS